MKKKTNVGRQPVILSAQCSVPFSEQLIPIIYARTRGIHVPSCRRVFHLEGELIFRTIFVDDTLAEEARKGSEEGRDQGS